MHITNISDTADLPEPSAETQQSSTKTLNESQRTLLNFPDRRLAHENDVHIPERRPDTATGLPPSPAMLQKSIRRTFNTSSNSQIFQFPHTMNISIPSSRPANRSLHAGGRLHPGEQLAPRDDRNAICSHPVLRNVPPHESEVSERSLESSTIIGSPSNSRPVFPFLNTPFENTGKNQVVLDPAFEIDRGDFDPSPVPRAVPSAFRQYRAQHGDEVGRMNENGKRPLPTFQPDASSTIPNQDVETVKKSRKSKYTDPPVEILNTSRTRFPVKKPDYEAGPVGVKRRR